MLNKRGEKSSNDENYIQLGDREHIYTSWLTLQRLLEVKASHLIHVWVKVAIWSMKVGICYKRSSEMSDRLLNGIITYKKDQKFWLLDFNQPDI